MLNPESLLFSPDLYCFPRKLQKCFYVVVICIYEAAPHVAPTRKNRLWYILTFQKHRRQKDMAGSAYALSALSRPLCIYDSYVFKINIKRTGIYKELRFFFAYVVRFYLIFNDKTPFLSMAFSSASAKIFSKEIRQEECMCIFYLPSMKIMYLY